LVGQVSGAFGDSPPAPWQAARDKVLQRLEKFDSYDASTLPITSLADLPQLTPIRTSRFSPADVETLDKAHKLKGLRLGHFGGFFHRQWRKEDYLWGRLTAAEQVVRLIVSLYDAPDSPLAEGAVRNALKAVFDEEPDLAGLHGADIDAARAKAFGPDAPPQR
jgi:hypothetical protein